MSEWCLSQKLVWCARTIEEDFVEKVALRFPKVGNGRHIDLAKVVCVTNGEPLAVGFGPSRPWRADTCAG
jgi:hypothetical protein